MVNYNATNVALYALGGSGDNLIGDGYIRATEKVWIDSYVMNTASVALLTTSDTLLIGYVPANKKIVSVEVVLPATWAPTTCAICVGTSYSTSLFISSSTSYFNINTSTTLVLTNKVTINNVLGQNFVLTSSTTSVSGGTILQNTLQGIYLSLTGANVTAPTNTTIQTIIRYT
jgi:hypothetical protein